MRNKQTREVEGTRKGGMREHGKEGEQGGGRWVDDGAAWWCRKGGKREREG